MKKAFYTSLFCFLFSLAAHATHIVGGSMTYRYLGPAANSGMVRYEITLDMYRDCVFGVPNFDNLAVIGIFHEATGNLHSKTSVVYDPSLEEFFNLEDSPVCIPLPEPICIHRGRYVFEMDFLDHDTEYRIVYQRCCRNALTMNIPDVLDRGITISTVIRPSERNSSARLKNDLPYFAFFNKPFSHDASATDADGDSLSYRLSFPKNGAGDCTSCPSDDPNFSAPDPPSLTTFYDLAYGPSLFSLSEIMGPSSKPLKIDEKTGEMTVLPALVGYFNVSFDIDEFRSGQKIATSHYEMAIIVQDGNTDPIIGGTVYLDPQFDPIDDAEVRLIERSPLTDSLRQIATTTVDPTDGGEYLFPNVYTSRYYLRAFPTDSTALGAALLPTYHPDAYFWYNATEVEVCHFSPPGVHIFMRTDSANLKNDGPSHIEGRLTDEVSKAPIEGYELWLVRTEDGLETPLRWTKTDKNGGFLFEKLRYGRYLLFSNQLNTAIKNEFPPSISINEQAAPAVEIEVEHRSDRLTVLSEKSVDPKKMEIKKLRPNPATDFVEFDLRPGETLESAELFDASGKRLLSSKSQKLIVSELPSGLYFLKVSTAKGQYTSRFVKI